MAKKKIGAYITLDGEKEFRTATSACNKSLATLKSEMKLVEAQTTGNANTLDTLKKKHDILSRTLDEQVRKEESIRSGLQHAEEQYEKVGNELDDYRNKLEQAQKTLQEMKNSSETTEDALEKQSKQVEQLEKIVSKGEKTYQQAGNRVQDWRKQLNNAEAQTIRATKALNENDTYLKEAQKSWNNTAKSIDEFGKETDKTVEKITEFGTVLKTNLRNTAVDIGKDAFASAVQGTIELDSAQRQLQASTGATAEATKEYSAQMQELYSSGYGDSIRDVADYMALVKQYTNETDPEKIRELAENGMALEDVFGMDFGESIRGADALMKNMGLDAKEAFDYIAKGAQNGLNKSNELGDNISEYSQLWDQAGFSAGEMFSILDNGLDSGAYNLDKVNDFVKEFGNSLADGRIQENLSAFSADTQNLFHQWQAGEATTKQVFQSVISDLASMENQQQALTIASNTWSALGEDNAMKVITSLNNVNNTYKNVHGTMEEVKNINYSGVANQWKVLGRTFQTDVMAPMLKEFLPAAEAGMEFLADNIEGVTAVAKVAAPVIAGMFVVKKGGDVVKALDEIQKGTKNVIKWVTAHTVAKTAETAAEAASTTAKTADTAATAAGTVATTAHTAATGAATAAQTAFNAALNANPIGLAVAGITALVGIVAVFASNTDGAKTKTEELKEEAEELKNKVEEASEELEKSTSEIKSSFEEVAASGQVAGSLVQELSELEAQSSRTADEQNRMQSIVMQLNTMFPEMGLEIDNVTGKLNMSSAEMESYIDTAIEMQKVQVVQEKMAESVEKLVDAEIAQAEAAQKAQDVESQLSAIQEKRDEINEAITQHNEELRQAQEDYSEALAEGAENADQLYAATQNQSEVMVEYNGELMTTTEALNKLAEDEQSLNDVQKEYAETLDEANEKIEKANEDMEPYTEYLYGMTDATKGNTDAVAENTAEKEKAAEQSQASIEMAGQELTAYQNLSTTQQQLAVDVTNGVLTMQENVQGALESQMNMFEEFDAGVQLSTEQLLSNMQSQIDGVTNWEQNLSSLADRGINQGLLQKLAEMGPQGAGYVQTFASMTDEELAKANDLWSQSVDIQSMTNDWGQQLLESGAANIAGGLENLTPIMQQSGANTVLGLVQGMQDAQTMAETSGQDLGVKVVDSVNAGLGVHSPSTKTMQSGMYVDQGLASGLTLGKVTVMIAAMGVAATVVTQINTALTASKFIDAGLNVSEGLASGIKKGKSLVIEAASEVASAAIKAANDKLEIHSPSHVFRRMGNNTMESYALGVKDRRKDVRNSVTDSLNFKGIEGKVDTKTGSAGAAEQQYLYRALISAMSQIKLVAYIGEREITRELSDLGVVFRAQV